MNFITKVVAITCIWQGAEGFFSELKLGPFLNHSKQRSNEPATSVLLGGLLRSEPLGDGVEQCVF